VDLEDLLASVVVRLGDEHVRIEPTRSKKGGIDVILAVGRSHYDEVRVLAHPVEFRQEL